MPSVFIFPKISVSMRLTATGYWMVVRAGGVILVEQTAKLGAPHHFRARVRGAGVHGLGKGLVEAVEEDEELGVAAAERVGGHAVQRTEVVDRMDDGPGQGEKDDAVALELEGDELAVGRRDAVALAPGQHDLGLQLDD